MNKKEVTGTAREVKGKIQKQVGKVAGDEETQAQGATEELKGKAEKGAGRLQGKVADVADDAKKTIHRATK